ncbi:MAG: ester cyclase [Deltaproteobacteria bacterium]|nr:ester cyclase [Deltaproteobacteria bacterium]MBZ0219817.1 ester cyclase [Deltaproteobacteria bacterium]
MEARKFNIEDIEEENLSKFDDLDYNVFSGQKWDQFRRSHHKDIVVHWPDGRETRGLDVHIKDLKEMFVYAPDTHIKEHPIRIAQGELTAVMGIMEGTFSKPMPVGNGQTIQPTGKSFRLSMATIGRWKDGVMVEEWLFWDNKAFMKQIGLLE